MKNIIGRVKQVVNNEVYDFDNNVYNMIDAIKDDIKRMNENISVTNASYDEDTNTIKVEIKETINYEVHKITL